MRDEIADRSSSLDRDVDRMMMVLVVDGVGC